MKKGGKMTFGEKMKEIRKAKGISLQKLSEKSNLSVLALWNCEHGKSLPTVVTISKIANALDYDYEELYDLVQKERN